LYGVDYASLHATQMYRTKKPTFNKRRENGEQKEKKQKKEKQQAGWGDAKKQKKPGVS